MRKNRHIFVLAVLLLSFLCIPVNKVLAASYAAEVPLTVKQSFEQKNNRNEINLTGSYEFRALDIGIPMPGDAQGDIYSFTLEGTKAEKTISLHFQHVGKYRYQLVQTTTDKEEYSYDRSVYTVTVYVKNGKDGELISQVIAEKSDGKKYGELEFQNFYNKENQNPSNPSSPSKPVETGDAANTAMYIMIASNALLLIILFSYIKIENKKNCRV